MIISAICVLAVVDIAFYAAVCGARESAREERITRDKWARYRRLEAGGRRPLAGNCGLPFGEPRGTALAASDLSDLSDKPAPRRITWTNDRWEK